MEDAQNLCLLVLEVGRRSLQGPSGSTCLPLMAACESESTWTFPNPELAAVSGASSSCRQATVELGLKGERL